MPVLLHLAVRLTLVASLLLSSLPTSDIFLPLLLNGDAEQRAAAPSQDPPPSPANDSPSDANAPELVVAAASGRNFPVLPEQAAALVHDEARLELAAGTVSDTITITMASLSSADLPPLDAGMTNVTKGPRGGYRFLPHMKFEKKLVVALPYNPAHIPPGLTEQDIHTYYFDETTGYWQQLERVEVDTKNKVVTSLTDHFTDMINATVTVPDHPEVLAYTPTSIRDIATADPGAQINLIAPPVPNPMGTARLVYPIELPPGRQGMAPALNLTYDSSAGNGWLGLGWELPIPEVSVETRWGVPRYADDVETESYLLDGAPLAPPAHRGSLQPRTAEKSFSLRIEGSFRRIIRHGDHPTNYWWEVVDKDGTHAYFGGDPATQTVHPTSVLTDTEGHIFQWKLREVRDANGNGIRYHYAVVEDTGLAPTGVRGVQLYPQQIEYTTTNGQAGAYTVTFVRDRELGLPRRPDVQIDARGGFKQVTADLLKQIIVTFEGALVRRYDLVYRTGAFDKTLLDAVSQVGEDGSHFHTHRFTYYDDVSAAGGYAGFDAPVTWDTGNNDHVTADLLGLGQASALGGTLAASTGVHLYMGFNGGAPTKQFSGGGKVGGLDSDSEAVLALIDLNGDNLPDKVFRAEDPASGEQRFFIRLNLSGPDGPAVFSDPPILLPTLPAIGRESSTTTSFGAEAYFGVSVMANTAETFSTATAYFSDVNGDGLPDLVQGGRVFFNYLEGNVPTFTLDDSSLTPAPIAPGVVDSANIVEDYTALFEQQVDKFPLHDTLRRWTAPFAGTILISGDVALLEDTSPARTHYQTADGVRVAVQHNDGEVWVQAIGPNDYDPKPLRHEDGAPLLLSVQKGDRLYFRVGSVFDGAFDQVAWTPQIQYVDPGTGDPLPAALDANGLDQQHYQAAQDFVLAGRRDIFVQMPLTGTVQLAGTLEKLGVTSDDLKVQVYHNDTIVHEQVLAGGDIVTIEPDVTIAVLPQDTVRLRIQVDSPIDVTQVQWTPALFYTAAEGAGKLFDDQGNPLFHLFPPYDIDLYPVNNLSAPQQPFIAGQAGAYSVQTDLATLNPQDASANGTVVFTVKRDGVLVQKATLTVANGAVNNTTLSFDAQAGERFFFDYSVYDPELGEKLGGAQVQVTPPGATDPTMAPSALHRAARPGVFAQPYRGWAYAGYNGNRDFAGTAIDEGRLVQDFTPDSEYNPDQATVYLFNPVPAEGEWRGPDNGGFVQAGLMSSSRLGPDAITIPKPGDFAGQRAVVRLSRTRQDAVQAGALFLSGSLSGFDPLRGESFGEVDYMDMNGDRYPDVVARGRIQYTTPDGGLDPEATPVDGEEPVRTTDARARNFAVGGSAALFKAGATGTVDNAGNGRPAENSTGSQMVTLGLGLGGSLGDGESAVLADLIDMNGDGLADRVKREGNQLLVALNLGYSFADFESWGQGAIHTGSSESAAISANLGILGFNDGIYGFAGGLSLSGNASETAQTLLDINGDGLVDQLRWDGAGLRVAINTGAGFAPEVVWQGALTGGLATDSNVGLGGGVYFTIGIGPLCLLACYVILNPGADLSENMARPEIALRDVDGDGNVDHAFSTEDSSLQVARNRTDRTNLLRYVERPLGASFEIAYARSGNTYDQPASRWVMSQVTLADGHSGDGVDTQLTTYRYLEGRYDRQEREFYGFAKIVEEQRDPAQGGSIYRIFEHEYFNDTFYTKGLLKRRARYDGAGRLFDESLYTYTLRDVTTGTEPVAGDSLTAAIFPQLTQVEQRFFEGGPTLGKSTVLQRTYDAFGNIHTIFEAGDDGAHDDMLATFLYSDGDPLCAANHIVGEPVLIQVTGNGAILRHREATVDCATGNVTQVRERLADGTTAVTDLAYFANGNLRQVTGPANHRGQHYQTSYGYDAVVETYVTTISDSFGYTSAATTHLKYGRTASTTDLNGNVTTYTYDVFGRISSVTGPYEQGGAVPTIRFVYDHQATPAWALTRHYDPLRDPAGNDTIDTVLFVDGLQRPLQTKKDGAVHTGPLTPPRDVMLVSGRLLYDAFGRTQARYYPVVEVLGTPTVFNPAVDSVAPTRYAFDVLDRTVQITLPDDTTTTMTHGFGADRDGVTRFLETVTDANGVSKGFYRDVRNQLVAVQELNQGGSEVIWTSYRYDGLQQLVQMRDAQDNLTHLRYDQMGRLVAVDSPDAGLIEYVYDTASNLTAKVTSNLRAEGKQIAYHYEFKRLAAITYPNFPANNVTYTYGDPGAADHRAGRITRITDASGSEERFYGKLGEVVKEVKTIASATQGNSGDAPEVYTTQYVYDTWNRLQQLTYPDGEIVTYRYDAGGNVRQVSGVKGSFTYAYVIRLEYDKFEEEAFVEAGNNVRTTYTYDPATRRLAQVQAGKGDGNPFQHLAYRYDDVGNVLAVTNQVAPTAANQLGGPSIQSYVYDDLYRLVGASGSFEYAPDKQNRYQMSLRYDTLHNLVSKQQLHEIVVSSGVPVSQQKSSYTVAYSYEGPQPHAPTQVGERAFHYDANGNQIGWTHTQNGTRRTVVFDEENRVQSISDNGQTQHYVYNHMGERIIKRGPQGEAVYVNSYFSIRNREVGTKHIFVGDTRYVSKLMKQEKPGANPSGQMPQEKDLYFYHADHLGSAQFVTDSSGQLYQHLEYFPSGETWVEETTNTQRVPYLFTGKELDEETGLYYYGARYYDPRLGIFTATDPVYSVDVRAGVEDPRLFNLYAYAVNNPLGFVDPDGGNPRVAVAPSTDKVAELHDMIASAGSVEDIERALKAIAKAYKIDLSNAASFRFDPALRKRGETNDHNGIRIGASALVEIQDWEKDIITPSPAAAAGVLLHEMVHTDQNKEHLRLGRNQQNRLLILIDEVEAYDTVLGNSARLGLSEGELQHNLHNREIYLKKLPKDLRELVEQKKYEEARRYIE